MPTPALPAAYYPPPAIPVSPETPVVQPWFPRPAIENGEAEIVLGPSSIGPVAVPTFAGPGNVRAPEYAPMLGGASPWPVKELAGAADSIVVSMGVDAAPPPPAPKFPWALAALVAVAVYLARGLS